MKILSLLALGTFIVILSCFWPKPASDQFRHSAAVPTLSPPQSATLEKPPRAKQIEKRWSSEFEFVTQSINKTHNGIRAYEISVDYPEIKERTFQAERFNHWMRRKMVAEVKRFERLERSAEAHDRKKKLDPAPISEGLKIWVDLYYAEKRFISLRLTYSVMALGQTHPIDYYETINYDLQRGRVLKQQDIFKQGYLKAFSNYSRAYISNTFDLSGTNDDWLNRGTEARQKNFPNWNIVPDGILIAFEDYQIGSHSFGQVELIIPYAQLKTVLRPNHFTAGFHPLAKRMWTGIR
jgi:hypothetical protein